MKKQKKIVVIDYHLGNLFSVKHAIINIGANAVISSDPTEIAEADALILPGVGAFGDAMKSLRELQLIDPIKATIKSEKPFFGVCLGLQLLFSRSEEFGADDGLGIINGSVLKFKAAGDASRLKVPQIAWNTISAASQPWISSPLKDLSEKDYVYFVHSFYVKPANENIILTETTYGGMKYASSIQIANIFACQFHPEKSGSKGLSIYKNWVEMNGLL